MSPWTSPNDPSFFLHHSNVDRLWAKWQDLYPELPYLPDRPIPELPGQSIDEKMKPFDVTVRSVLNYREMGYQYDGKASDDQPLPDSQPAPDSPHPDHHESVSSSQLKVAIQEKFFLQ
jgi:hypothetical protein